MPIIIYVARYNSRNVSHDQFRFGNFTFVSRHRRTYKHNGVTIVVSYFYKYYLQRLPASHVYPGTTSRDIVSAYRFLIDPDMDMGPIVRSRIRNRRLHAKPTLLVLAEEVENNGDSLVVYGYRARKTPSALDFARVSYAFTRTNGMSRAFSRDRLNAGETIGSVFPLRLLLRETAKNFSPSLFEGTRVYSFASFYSPLFLSLSSCIAARDALRVSSRLVRSRRDLRGKVSFHFRGNENRLRALKLQGYRFL